MTETNTPAPSAPQTQTPRTDTLWSQIEHTPSAFEMAALTRTLELESAARQRVIDAIERECESDLGHELIVYHVLAIIADGKEGK